MALPDKKYGLVAILDALGAANYREEEIGRFLRSREIILTLLNEKAESLFGELAAERLSTFTFNDTVLVLYRTDRQTTVRDVKAFFMLLRKFMVDSLVHRVLFRGSIAMGGFYANDETNTVMGPAITDAAAWYDRADWIGIHATPHATMVIESLPDYDAESYEHVILSYEVPMKDGPAVQLKVVNWPKAFFVKELTPCRHCEEERPKLLELLVKHQVPKGTERKYSATVEFFDKIAAAYAAKKKSKKTAPTRQRNA